MGIDAKVAKRAIKAIEKVADWHKLGYGYVVIIAKGNVGVDAELEIASFTNLKREHSVEVAIKWAGAEAGEMESETN